MRKKVVRSWCLGTALLFAGHAAAAPPTQPLPAWHTSMYHAAWYKKDGAPAAAASMAQDGSGMLWIGASDGLHRFDGVRFSRITALHGSKLPSTGISALRAEGDTLWIAYRFGGVTQARAGAVRHYGAGDGTPEASGFAFARDRQGVLWLASAVGLFRLDGARWQRSWPAAGEPQANVRTLTVLADGDLLLSGSHGVYRGRDGQFRLLSPLAVAQASLRPDGTVMLRSRDDTLHLYDPATDRVAAVHLPALLGEVQEMTVDQRGALWLLTAAGLHLMSPALTVQKTFAPSTGFSGRTIHAFLDDREGNLWFTTEAGLDRLRESRLNNIGVGAPQTLSFAVTPGNDGSIWVGNAAALAPDRPALFRQDADGSRHATPIPNVTAWTHDLQGRLWVASRGALWQPSATGVRHWPLPVEWRERDVQALVVDRDGLLWASIIGHGLRIFRDGRWERPPLPPATVGNTAIALARDGHGNLWIAYPGNAIARLAPDGSVREYGAADGLAVGDVLTLHPRGKRLWLGGSRGLAWLALDQDGATGQRVHAVEAAGAHPFAGVSGIVETANGDLWLHDAEGIARIDAAALAAVRTSEHASVASERFDYLDGYQGVVEQFRPLPTLAAADDGRLWYATLSTVGWLDPQRIPRSSLAPTPHITALDTEHGNALQAKLSSGRPVLAPGTGNVTFDFTAAVLAVPERARFRYRLLGQDKGWQDAGSRRQAFYTNLGPGDYVFEVLASNEDGVWSPQPARLAFTVQPRFYQTGWFAMLCLAATLALGYAIVRWRVQLATRRTEERMHERMHERLTERTRIARTLHDTFLQSVQALILRMEMLKQRLPPDTHAELDAALHLAEAVGEEGRQQVMALRSEASFGGDVLAAMSDLIRLLSARHGVRITLDVRGKPRLFAPHLAARVQAILGEALSNACRHAGCQQMTLELHYRRHGFRARVLDTGKGIDATVLAAGGKHGHWGMVGMREQAEQIGARLDVALRQGGGTEVVLQLAAPWRNSKAAAAQD